MKKKALKPMFSLKKRLNPGVELKETPDRGRGVFASRYFVEGEVTCEWIGTYTLGDVPEDDYCLADRDNGGYYTANRDVPGAQLANHSCDPNCVMMPSKSGQVLVASRTIREGEEITWYYGWMRLQPTECRCGSRYCVGQIDIPTTLDEGSSILCMLDLDKVRNMLISARDRGNTALVSALLGNVCMAFPGVLDQFLDIIPEAQSLKGIL
jgi:hypothetical protein